MADIDVQRKSGAPWWVWLLGLLLLAALVWFLWGLLANNDDADRVGAVAVPVPVPVAVPVASAADSGVPAAGAVPAAVQGYLAACTAAAGGEPADMGREHQFTATCFRDLGAAIDTVMTERRVSGVDVESRRSSYDAAVRRLEESQASSTEHARYAKEAADAASALMQAMLTTGYAGQQEVTIAVGQVESAANGIRPTGDLLQQRDAVRGFFRQAGEALRIMAQRSATAGASA